MEKSVFPGDGKVKYDIKSTSRLTPRKKETNVGIKALLNGFTEVFEATYFPNSQSARKVQRRTEYRIADDYCKKLRKNQTYGKKQI